MDLSMQCPGDSDFPREVYNDLRCPICLEFFKHPIILPCSHVLCRSPCTEHLFDFNFIRCPVCRENCYISGGIGSLPRVIALESIIEKYRTERRKAIKCASKGSKSLITPAVFGGGGGGGGGRSEGIGGGGTGEAAETGIHAVSSSGACSHDGNSGFAAENSETEQRKSSPVSSRCSEDSMCFPATITVARADDISQTPRNNLQSLSHEPLANRSSLLSISSTPRHFESLDTSLLDVTFDSVTSCPRHGLGSSLYCQVCERCVCDVCGDADHVTAHETNTLDEASLQVKSGLVRNVDKMVDSQMKVMDSLQQQRQHQKDMEQHFNRKREDIDMQCDSLLAEVEHKRGVFLADLDQEERMRHGEIDDVIEVFEKILAASQSLTQYTTELCEKDSATVLQVSPALNDQILGSMLDCEACQVQPDDLHPDFTQGKVVDLRKEQCLLRDICYLNPPGAPNLDLARCARNHNSVALFLVPHRGSDVVDTYVIRYCSEDQKNLGIEETVTFQNGHSDHLSSGGQGIASLSYVALLDNLSTATTYLFCTTAANRAGHSPNSEVVQCVTLTHSDSVVPAPVILTAMCKTYTSSIRVFTPSPHDVAPEQSISHFLLYRSRNRKSLWRSVALCGRAEHRLFGLEPETLYEFVVMATNPGGECQLSERVVLETEKCS
ncbi:hypothetical protein V1264_007873 [Littorina saxatilis]